MHGIFSNLVEVHSHAGLLGLEEELRIGDPQRKLHDGAFEAVSPCTVDAPNAEFASAIFKNVFKHVVPSACSVAISGQ